MIRLSQEVKDAQQLRKEERDIFRGSAFGVILPRLTVVSYWVALEWLKLSSPVLLVGEVSGQR